MTPIRLDAFKHAAEFHESFRARPAHSQKRLSVKHRPSTFCVPPIPDFCALSKRSRQNGGRLRSNQQLTSMSELTLPTEHEVRHRESDANDPLPPF
jgi:hypothetical protein